jgi:hypothetical protein
VTRPGGRIVMGNWIPNDPTLVAQILKISASYLPPPPEGFISPMTWGIEGNVIERYAAAGISREKISFVKDTYSFKRPSIPVAQIHGGGTFIVLSGWPSPLAWFQKKDRLPLQLRPSPRLEEASQE